VLQLNYMNYKSIGFMPNWRDIDDFIVVKIIISFFRFKINKLI
jgi:hypothetical protein